MTKLIIIFKTGLFQCPQGKAKNGCIGIIARPQNCKLCEQNDIVSERNSNL